MKRILRLGKKKREFSPNSSDNGSVHSMGYEIRDKDLGKVHKAASTGDVAKLKQLAKKTDMNQLDRESRTPLHIASANGHAEAVEFLAENNANVNLCDNQNMSPLMKAVQCQQDQCVEILLKHNADHKLVDLNGNTALHMAALIPSVPLAALLLEHKANINAQNKDGCTPLVLSVAENHTEMVEFLVNRGADLNAKDQLSRTPLMIAACNGQINFVQLLLESNADITITDEKGWTSDDYAVINGHHACSHLIVEHETKRRSFQTLSPLFPNKKKPPLSSGNTSHVVDRGLSLGGPAINKDVDEQHSLDESISRASAKCGVDNSWPSSQEEDSLDFSPKKHAKVNLKEFLNSSDKGKKKVISEPEKSWSDGDFEQKCNDRAQSNPVLSSALPHSGNSINAPPPSPCSFSNVPQMTSTPLHSTEKKEVTENAEENKKRANKICEQESIKHDNLMDAECIVGERNIPRVDVVNKTTVNGELKRDFLSELGLRDCADDEESMWDSEPSAAESPRKLPSGTNSSSSNVQNRALPLDYNEDTFYVPSFLRGPGSCKLSNLDRLIDQTGQASKGDAHQSLDEQAAVEPAQQLPEVNCSAIKNPDLMEELGLGDVDDIEVSSEWDSNSSASKSSSAHKQENISLKADPELISSTPLGETAKSLSPTDKGNHAGAVSSYQKPVLPYYRNLTPYPKSKLNKVQQLQGRKLNVEGNEDEDADDVSDWDSDVDLTHSSPSKSTNIQKLKIGNRSGFTQEPLDIQPGEANSESMKRAVSETSMDSPEEKSLLATTELTFSNTRHFGQGEIETEHTQQEEGVGNEEESDEVSWEKRYENIWVETEKREVKTHYKSVAAELKEKFGEIALKETSQATEEGEAAEEGSSEDEMAGSAVGRQNNVLHPIPEQQESGLEDSLTDPAENKAFVDVDKEPKLLDPERAKESNEEPGQGQETSAKDLQYSCGDQQGEDKAEEEDPIGIESPSEHPKASSKSSCLPKVGNPSSTLRCSDEELKKDLHWFRHEVGMLKVIFLEKSQMLKENDGKDQWPEAAITQYELLPNFADVVKQSENLDIFTALDERKCKDPTEMEFDELTQSSDTATDDVDSFTTGYRNASELIRQLDSFSIDSVSLVKLQNIFHEYERTIQRERSRCSRLADKLRQQEQEQGESRQGLEEMRSSKSTLELRQVELETDLHNFKFLLKQEQDKHRNLQMLYDKSREQLAKKDAEYRLGVEERQKLELTVRNMELEIRALNNSIKQLEEDNTEIQHVLSQERNARSMQESILSNYLCKHKEIEEENVRKLNMSNEALLQMTEMGSNREKELQLLSCSLQEEVKKLKLDLECSHQEASRFTEENEVLKERLEDLKQDLKLSEGTFTQSIFQYNSQLASLKAESTVSAAKLESERQAREKVEAEMQSTLERLNAALKEVENCQGSRVEAERVLKREKDSWKESLEKQLSDAATHRKANQSLSQQLARAETKANNLENECHRATLSLTEKNLLLESLQREREENRARLSELEATLQQEREQVSRTAAKQEATLQRLVQAQSEATLLRQQVDQAQNKGAAKERAAADAQERFSDLLAKLRADSDERVCVAEERCKELSNKNAELREQLTKQEQERNEREGGVRHMQQELADLLKKLSMSEASLEVNSRYRCDLEEEKLRMLKDMERFKAKLRESDEQHNQDINRIHDLKSALDDKEREVMASTQKLQETISNTASTENTIRQLEGAVQRLEIENARLEGATKQQMTKIEVLQKSAQEMAQQRNRLEELVSNLQGTRMSLEEQLSREVQKQSMLNNSAQNSQQLWEEEMKTRSRLGLRLAQLEKEKNELSGQVDCERKKVKKVVDLKKSVDLRLEQEMKRNNDLQKELFRLKNLVKMAKKQLRELEGIEPDCHGSSLLGEHRQQTEAAVERMKSRMEVLSQQLDREMLKCSQLEATNTELKDQLSSLKTSSHNHKLLEEEVAALRRKLGAGVMDQSQAEQFKKETEERARQEIMQKLDEVNLFLQTHAASQEALEQVKAANEASMRSQMEQRIRDLESELARVQSLQQERDSIKVELDRYRDLYSEELRLRKTLSSKLDRSKERLAEANTKLLAERQRSSSIMVSNLTNPSPDATLPNLATVGPLGKGLAFGGSSQKSKVEAYLAQIQSEMEKNISQELTKAATEIEVQSSRVSPVGSASGSLKNSSPSALATAQYLEMMKKSYNL